ncbi:hypothetical protein ACJMK2_021351 [Sinanodonta woodiana]|uniref:MAM domain-containing protein n=1 Tax=Sinanodonta woodiana TaxID=1069815 RepID=A0ABD3TGS8_SINWO
MSQLTSLCAYICIYSIINVAFTMSCDFQSECSEWTIEKSWTRMRSGESKNNSNVPKTDHTLGKGVGFYLYLISSPNQITVARLLSTPLKQLHTCLIFWYSMYESDVQSLQVFITLNDSTKLEIWNKIGNMPYVWNEARVTFSYDREFQIVFEGKKASDGHMALDDISVTYVCPATSTQSIVDNVTPVGNTDSKKNQLSSTSTQSISDNVTSIGNTDSEKNQLSYGVYVGISTGFAAILLITCIVTIIIVRKKRRRHESQKKETIMGVGYLFANNHGDRREEEKANISNQTPDEIRTEINEIHVNVHTSTNNACAEIPDAQYDKVANTGYETTNILPYKQANISDYVEVDDVSITRYEPLRQRDGDTYDHISGKYDYENTT